ncbi:MAG: hypothetical protein JWP06_638 [Candidatus Saccharibacteria bacterium]|nr:hypothetical protein [Candidatus Saccharibacteria bacterium]
MNEPEYKITEDDILAMLEYLRHTAPEHATPEKAIFLLEQRHAHYKNLEDLHPELIEEILKDLETN